MFAGANVLVSGAVAGDVSVAGGTVSVLSDVTGDVRLLGGTVIVQSGVGEDLLIAGGQVTLGGDGVLGEVVIAGGQISITAPVKGDVRVYGGEVFLDSVIDGDVLIQADKIILGENAVLNGNFVYTSVAEASIAEGALIVGETVYTPSEGNAGEKLDKASVIAFFAVLAGGVFLAKFFMLLLGALLFGYFFRRFAREVVARGVAKPWNQLGRGVVWVIVLPVVSVLLLTTIIGIPLGVLGLFVFGAVMIVGSFAAAILSGSVVHKWITKSSEYRVDWKTILLGVFMYGVVFSLVPFIGWVIKMAVFLVALGAMWDIKVQALKDWR
jgi:hypothetical protein